MALLVALGTPNSDAQEPRILHGRWVATAGGKQTFRGKWIGQSLPGDVLAMHGSWSLTDAAGRTILSGTWRARKTDQGWRGTWSAETEQRRPISGSWKADTPGIPGASLESMFAHTSDTEVSGSWRAGNRQGYWWLRGQRPPPRLK